MSLYSMPASFDCDWLIYGWPSSEINTLSISERHLQICKPLLVPTREK